VSGRGPQSESLAREMGLRLVGSAVCGFALGAAIAGSSSLGAIVGATIGAVWCLLEAIRLLIRGRARHVQWTIAIVLGISTLAYAVDNTFFPGKPFDATVWRERESRDNGARQQMADRLISRHSLDGRTRAEVQSMLGTPSWPSSDSSLHYLLGRERPLLGPLVPSSNCEWLTIHFGKDDRVLDYHLGTISHCGCVDSSD
jgi:hypothetical protein